MSKAIAINTTRRDFVTAMSAVVAAAIPTAAIASVPVVGDTAIFARDPELMEAHSAFLAALDVQALADERYFAAKEANPDAKADELRVRAGVALAETEAGTAGERVAEIAEAILATPASTIEGVRFKLRLSRVVWEPDVLAAITDDIVAITGRPIDFLR